MVMVSARINLLNLSEVFMGCHHVLKLGNCYESLKFSEPRMNVKSLEFGDGAICVYYSAKSRIGGSLCSSPWLLK
ncbi:hypothetical protein EUTSA_v10011912mg [Eutrema salsugineum]|uniref:Uncharacterized protein n=1 Tax=Eutrema salsugineum TaxID=72664 RepID=V4MGB7_EUTSA|nr:hypothetical protein EUTSA_v10011912mg [Eutrema salsugineum]